MSKKTTQGPTKKQKRLLIFASLLIVVLGGVYFLYSAESDRPQIKEEVLREISDSEEQKITDFETNEVITEDKELIRRIMTDENTVKVIIEDEFGNRWNGTFYILIAEQKTYALVKATLPDPFGETTYQAWLVKEEEKKKPEYFSLGEMKQESEEFYATLFESNEKIGEYTYVLITEETTVDDRPEREMLRSDPSAPNL